MKLSRERTVFVAMSGGVDSSVAALLLKHAGWRVVGVYMKPWSPSTGISNSQFSNPGCMWQSERADALRVAASLDIPLETWDFSRQYGRRVADAMIRGYRRGITPNPDVECNRHIKFGLFYQRAMKEGADFVATGHYARIREIKNQKSKIKMFELLTAEDADIVKHETRSMKHGKKTLQASCFMLHTARDSAKDQTYFLWNIPPAVLSRTLFPIGHLTKPQVRAIARKAGLATALKKDSQGVCFVGELNVKDFLASRIASKRGAIVHTDGRVLGTHDGAAYYTIGQRHGLDIKGGDGPYFVVKKDMRTNTITVGSERDLYGSKTRLTATNWFGPRPKVGEKVMVKIRYRTPAYAAVFGRGDTLSFIKPVRAITPGQSAVFYKNSRLLGGGIIV